MIAFFLTVAAPANLGDVLAGWARETVVAALCKAEGLAVIEGYFPTPEGAADPLTDDGRGPALLVEAGFDDLAALQAAVASAAARAAFAGCPAAGREGCRVDCEAFEVSHYPVAGEDRPAARTAPLSFVVRYYRPAEDETAFRDFYLANHPPILGRFPGIRNVLCYLPLKWENGSGLAVSDCMLGNEVVFDSALALNAALASEVRHELRRDYEGFPAFSGPVSHHAMVRERLWTRS